MHIMHEIIHLEPPQYLERATKKKESTKSYKKAWNQYSPKKRNTKATKTLQINTFLEGIWKGKSKYSIRINDLFLIYIFFVICLLIFIYIHIKCLMVPGHQFQVYLTLTKSCIYARNHTLRKGKNLEKATSQKQKESTKSYKKAWNQYSF